MRWQTWSVMGLAASVAIFLTAGATLAQCNLCTNGCGGLGSHYDVCDVAFEGWSGGCVEGCKPWSSCSIHPADCPAGFTSLADLKGLVLADAWHAVAGQVEHNRLLFDAERPALFLRNCEGDHLVGHYPLSPQQAERLLGFLEDERSGASPRQLSGS